jgi:hypothetical protein
MAGLAVELAEGLRPAFGRQPVLGRHRLHESALFTDTSLIELLERFPRQHLYAFHMGTDPSRVEDNRLALHAGIGGAELLRAVRDGRLWLNLTRVDRADASYRCLVDELLGELGSHVRGFEPLAGQGTLLISSPQAIVYYHADGPASVLWHLRGRKRVWVYPALDRRFVARELLEDIFAGVRHEYLPYEPGFDAAAQVHDLEPGQWIAWPQNAPHRIANLDGVNVSLSTEYFTRDSRARFQVYCANRFLRTRLGLQGLSVCERGVLARGKVAVQRIARKLGLDRLPVRQYVATMRVAADAPGGAVPLPSPEGCAP